MIHKLLSRTVFAHFNACKKIPEAKPDKMPTIVEIIVHFTIYRTMGFAEILANGLDMLAKIRKVKGTQFIGTKKGLAKLARPFVAKDINSVVDRLKVIFKTLFISSK